MSRHPLIRERSNMELLKEILLLHDKFSGLNRKVQIKPVEDRRIPGMVTQVQVVAKWGGEIANVEWYIEWFLAGYFAGIWCGGVTAGFLSSKWRRPKGLGKSCDVINQFANFCLSG